MTLQEVLEELRFQAEYEKSKDGSVRTEQWTPDYVEGYCDGLLRAVEIIEERL